MATWDSAYLLKIFNRLVGQPTTSATSDADKYERLSEAQNEIIADLAGICPHVLYPPVGYAAIPTLSTTDHQTFTFGTDANGYPITPIGKVGVFTSLEDIPSCPWREGVDYIALGGTAIQIPNNNTYTGTLYWRGIANPSDITATVQPALFPEASRELIAIRAAHAWATEFGRNPALAELMAVRYGAPLLPGVEGRFAAWCLTWKTQFRTGGALGRLTGLQVASGSALNAGVA